MIQRVINQHAMAADDSKKQSHVRQRCVYGQFTPGGTKYHKVPQGSTGYRKVDNNTTRLDFWYRKVGKNANAF